jgi:MFS family permease
VCGPPVSLLLLTVREPARGGPAWAGAASVQAAGDALRHVRQRLATYVPLVGYVTFGAMMSFGQSAWLPAMLGRKWGVAPDHLGPMLGAVTLVCGVLGLVLTGVMLRLMAANGRDIRSFGALAAIAAAAGLAGAAVMPNFAASMVSAGTGLFFVGASYPIGATTLSQITPVHLMGRVSAGYLMLQTLLGQALGPMLIALTADLFSGHGALPLAFALTMLVFGAIAAVAAVTLRRAVGGRGVDSAAGNRRLAARSG